MQNVVLLLIGVALSILSIIVWTNKNWANKFLFTCIAFLASMSIMAGSLQHILFPDGVDYHQASKSYPDLFNQYQQLGIGLVPVLFIGFMFIRILYQKSRLPKIVL